MPDFVPRLLRFILGFIFLGLAILLIGQKAIIVGLPLAVTAGILLHPLITDPVSSMLSGMLYSGKAGDLPEQFSHARIHLANQQPQAALDELDAVLTSPPDPKLLSGYLLKARILFDELAKPDLAVETIKLVLPLAVGKQEHKPLAMLAADCYLDKGQPAVAADLLAQEAARATDKDAANGLRQRAESIRSNLA